MIMRLPVAEGFYPNTQNEIKDLIKKYFSEINVKKRNVRGAIVPHAGYTYSGKTAAYAYKSLLKDYESVILIGPNHTGVGGKTAVSKENWETSLGIIKNDRKLADKLLDLCELIKVDELPHMYEHSIEVQLPFLQYVLGDFKFVPLSIASTSNLELYRQVGSAIRKLTEKKKILVLATSDFTHFGAMYNFVPVNKNQVEWVEDTDKKLIESILKFDVKRFMELSSKTTLCGSGAIATLLFAMQGRKVKLLDYSTSYDISKNKDAIVGYTGMIFE